MNELSQSHRTRGARILRASPTRQPCYRFPGPSQTENFSLNLLLSANPSVNEHYRDGPRSHERGHLCSFCEHTAVELHAYRQKNHCQKARAKDRS